MMPLLLSVLGASLAVAVVLILVRADRALNEARDLRHHLVDDKRRADDAHLRVDLAIRQLEGLAEMVHRQQSRASETMAMAGQILRAEHDDAVHRHSRSQ